MLAMAMSETSPTNPPPNDRRQATRDGEAVVPCLVVWCHDVSVVSGLPVGDLSLQQKCRCWMSLQYSHQNLSSLATEVLDVGGFAAHQYIHQG